MKITRISIRTAIFSCLINITAAGLEPIVIHQNQWSQSADIERNFQQQRESWGKTQFCDLRKNDKDGGMNFPDVGLTVAKGPSQDHAYVINHNNYVVEYLMKHRDTGWYLKQTAQPKQQHIVPIWDPPIIAAWARFQRRQ
ncbi:hypothetical protein PGT21_002194 [Puccinia graminis f. sp. tritici]|uniref:Uncharacterized protein n=1 Tax=Puccinia graminis f. sp. tritici TaxID=56615 RepID=A0A5B0PTL3_PUCGR|nr:hypothetical protein PGT21_002194 [Puccinia graminis f. sp. tritici]KAA1105115.1 hypothetical protein PGTUg99_012811 [Puccinia graminis f. sp. tritici]